MFAHQLSRHGCEGAQQRTKPNKAPASLSFYIPLRAFLRLPPPPRHSLPGSASLPGAWFSCRCPGLPRPCLVTEAPLPVLSCVSLCLTPQGGVQCSQATHWTGCPRLCQVGVCSVTLHISLTVTHPTHFDNSLCLFPISNFSQVCNNLNS